MLPKPFACGECVLVTAGLGFMQTDLGSRGDRMFVGESLGAQEVEAGRIFVGPAGRRLNEAFQMGGMERSEWDGANVVWCQPPNNRLQGYYEAKQYCPHHHLDPFIRSRKPRVIVALGATACHHLTGEWNILEVRGYPVWNGLFGCWIMPTVHPSFIQRGNFEYQTVLIHDLQRAAEIAEQGYEPCNPPYDLDPSPAAALKWAEYALQSPHPMAYDIETWGKAGVHEDEVDPDDGSYIIDRISFSAAPYTAMSVPWDAPYIPAIKLLMESDKEKVVWNKHYDNPRIIYNGVRINGTVHDAMIAWHVLNSDQRKNLNSAATYLCPDQPRWKHLHGAKPAWYSAVDSDVELRCFLRCREVMHEANVWEVYQRQVLDFDVVADDMSRAGMPIDPLVRYESAVELQARFAEINESLEGLVPQDIRRKKVFARTPKDTTGLTRLDDAMLDTPVCPKCGVVKPLKPHFKVYKKKDNPCGGLEPVLEPVQTEQWCRYEPLKLSPQLILAYGKLSGHPVQYKGRGRDKKPTTDEDAIKTLLLTFPEDPFYPLSLDKRKVQKLLGTYMGYPQEDGRTKGGLAAGGDDRVHCIITHNPSTLRTATENPNLQNLPRTGERYANMVKGMFKTPVGSTFLARDYSGIEAVLVGYLSGSQSYTRLAQIDVHTYVTVHALHLLEGALPASDLPDLAWSDDDLEAYLAGWKKREKTKRTTYKRWVHGGNYLMKAKGMQRVVFDELDLIVPLKDVKAFRAMYFELFPEISKWHYDVARRVDGTRHESPDAPSSAMQGLTAGVGYLRNAFDFVHRFHGTLRWTKVQGEWSYALGEGARAAVAFGPQSIASAIGKEAAMRMREQEPELAHGLRLFVHDELLGEWPDPDLERANVAMREAMEYPVPQLPLDPSWGMGDHLTIYTEGKAGPCWATMEDYE